jgi:hypothetical protein
MRILRIPASAPKLEPHGHFFAELCYGMTHIGSMDSHRVRCMNLRTIAREPLQLP